MNFRTPDNYNRENLIGLPSDKGTEIFLRAIAQCLSPIDASVIDYILYFIRYQDSELYIPRQNQLVDLLTDNLDVKALLNDSCLISKINIAVSDLALTLETNEMDEAIGCLYNENKHIDCTNMIKSWIIDDFNTLNPDLINAIIDRHNNMRAEIKLSEEYITKLQQYEGLSYCNNRTGSKYPVWTIPGFGDISFMTSSEELLGNYHLGLFYRNRHVPRGFAIPSSLDNIKTVADISNIEKFQSYLLYHNYTKGKVYGDKYENIKRGNLMEKSDVYRLFNTMGTYFFGRENIIDDDVIKELLTSALTKDHPLFILLRILRLIIGHNFAIPQDLDDNTMFLIGSHYDQSFVRSINKLSIHDDCITPVGRVTTFSKKVLYSFFNKSIHFWSY